MQSVSLARAHQILRTAVAGVGAEQWSAPTPCEQWSVAQVTEHAALDQLAYATALTGGDKPSADPFQPTGELPGGADAFVGRAVTASADAFAAVPGSMPAVAVPLPPFSLPPDDAAAAAALDAAVHGWDIAVATGQPVDFPPELAVRLLAVAEQLVEPLRGWGAYAAAIGSGADADDLTRLLNYLGRRADWTAGAL